MTATALATKTQDIPARRKLPAIDPVNVRVDASGHVRKSFVVRLPAGMIADDLKESSIWAKVQKSDRPLRQHDAVYLIAFDQAWVVEAIASEASAEGVTLAGVRIVQTPQRARALYRDDTYQIVWNGVGFHVERIKDAHKMTTTAHTEQLAERDLRALYPTQVTGGLR